MRVEGQGEATAKGTPGNAQRKSDLTPTFKPSAAGSSHLRPNRRGARPPSVHLKAAVALLGKLCYQPTSGLGVTILPGSCGERPGTHTHTHTHTSKHAWSYEPAITRATLGSMQTNAWGWHHPNALAHKATRYEVRKLHPPTPHKFRTRPHQRSYADCRHRHNLDITTQQITR